MFDTLGGKWRPYLSTVRLLARSEALLFHGIPRSSCLPVDAISHQSSGGLYPPAQLVVACSLTVTAPAAASRGYSDNVGSTAFLQMAQSQSFALGQPA